MDRVSNRKEWVDAGIFIGENGFADSVPKKLTSSILKMLRCYKVLFRNAAESCLDVLPEPAPGTSVNLAPHLKRARIAALIPYVGV